VIVIDLFAVGECLKFKSKVPLRLFHLVQSMWELMLSIKWNLVC
jgi:hypothetical protein